jgi:hypothetical protein
MTVTNLPTPLPGPAVDAWHAVVHAAHTHDLPAHVPPPGRVETEGKLRTPSVNSRALHRVAVAADGSYDGVATAVLFTDENNRHTAFLDQLARRERPAGLCASATSATSRRRCEAR